MGAPCRFVQEGPPGPLPSSLGVTCQAEPALQGLLSPSSWGSSWGLALVGRAHLPPQAAARIPAPPI